MKKQLAGYTFLLLVLAYYSGVCCSGYTRPFCIVNAESPADPVIEAFIVSKGPHHVKLRVLQVLRGVESRSTITVWDGDSIYCGPSWWARAASMLGEVGDTLVVILPKIVNPVNDWDVIGDYNLPMYLFRESWLTVRNDTLRGLIGGKINEHAPGYHYFVKNMALKDFIAFYSASNMDCSSLLSSAEQKTETSINVSVRQRQLVATTSSALPHKIYIMDMASAILFNNTLSRHIDIDLQSLPRGLLLVRVVDPAGKQFVQKILVGDYSP